MNTTVTLNIGNLFEEELTGQSDQPYINYYTFAGKMVGMRKGNQPDPADDRQLRVVGDQLGSTTLVIDTSPQVVHRQYYKPYGEITWTHGTTQTSIGYTGQRLDQDSGLMYYNARFYDPVLSYFVSADTIAPNPADPKTRNRYSYVSNNPIRYNDPSGHCRKETRDDKNELAKCNDYLWQLGKYGIEIGDLDEWSLEDVFLALTAVKDMASKGNGGHGWSADEFKDKMGLKGNEKITLLNEGLNSGNYSGCAVGGECSWGYISGNGRTITIDLEAHRQYRMTRRDDPDDNLKVTLVHELAHAWEVASGRDPAGGYNISNQLWGNIAGKGPAVAGIPSEYGESAYTGACASWSPPCSPPREYFAESVAAYVYPRSKFYERYAGSYHPGTIAYDYVAEKFGPRPCLPLVGC